MVTPKVVTASSRTHTVSPAAGEAVLPFTDANGLPGSTLASPLQQRNEFDVIFFTERSLMV